MPLTINHRPISRYCTRVRRNGAEGSYAAGNLIKNPAIKRGFFYLNISSFTFSLSSFSFFKSNMVPKILSQIVVLTPKP